MRLALLGIWVLLAFGCSKKEEPASDVEVIVGRTEGGDFRGNSMGDVPDEVLHREEPHVVYTMPDEITCRIPLGMKDSTFYEVSYSFDDGKLHFIQLDLYPRNEDDLGRLQIEFESYYGEVYPVEEDLSGRKTWKALSVRGKEILIRLSDRSNIQQRPCLTVTFLEND